MTSQLPSENQNGPSRSRRKRFLKIGAGMAGLLVVLAGVGIWWFLRDDAPDEVSLESAVESVVDTTAEFAVSEESTATDSESELSGTWTVDSETGDFDYESATGSFVGFRIEEELSSIGSTTAVGRTGDITGTMVIDGTTVTAATIDIDMTTITTNSSQRDDNVQDALETDQFPSGAFSLTEAIDLGDDAAAGGAVSVTANGDLTIHGVTQPVMFDVDAQLVDGTVVVVGSTEITFSDYGVEVPSGGPVISVDDFGILELQLLLTA